MRLPEREEIIYDFFALLRCDVISFVAGFLISDSCKLVNFVSLGQNRLLGYNFTMIFQLKLKTLFIISLISMFCLSFTVGDEVELESFLNARTSPNFLSKTKNVATVLAKGTSGKVLSIKEFPSGNSGIQMKVLSGPKAGETYWVYQNKLEPALKLKTILGLKLIPKEESQTIATTLRTVNSYLDPVEFMLKKITVEPALLVSHLDTVLSPVTIKCNPALLELLPLEKIPEKIPEEMYTEANLVEPFRDVPRVKKGNPRFGPSQNSKNYSVGVRDGLVESFKFKNTGPNKIVKNSGDGIGREFQFEFNDRARSDVRLIVEDAVDDNTSTINYSIFMFFPRKVLPSVAVIGDEIQVTIPTGEVVKYNAKTLEVIGGVLDEGPLVKSAGSKKAAPTNLVYKGEGIVIKASKNGDLPYGDIERKDGSKAPSISMATISKKGFPDCKIESKNIWYSDSERGDALIKPELATDEGFNNFLKNNCSFSLF